MSYVKNSPLKKIKKKLNKVLTENQKNRIKKHRDRHMKNSCPKMLRKHMKVMRDLMKQGHSFRSSHMNAESKYPLGDMSKCECKKKMI